MQRLLATLLCAVLNTAHAENSLFVKNFAAMPGARVPHAYRYGKPPQDHPVYCLRIPSIDQQIASVFVDLQVVALSAEETVLEVNAERAYRDLAACGQALNAIKEPLSILLPGSDPSDPSRFTASDGSVGALLRCEKPRHRPFPILYLHIGLAKGTSPASAPTSLSCNPPRLR